MVNRRVATARRVAAIVLAACSAARPPHRPRRARQRRRAERRGQRRRAEASAAAAAGCMVGVSWNNYQEERWAKWDEPAIKAALDGRWRQYISNDAKSSAETQATQHREPDLPGRQGR